MAIMENIGSVKVSNDGNFGTCSHITISRQDIVIMLQQLEGIKRKLKAKLQTV